MGAFMRAFMNAFRSVFSSAFMGTFRNAFMGAFGDLFRSAFKSAILALLFKFRLKSSASHRDSHLVSYLRFVVGLIAGFVSMSSPVLLECFASVIFFIVGLLGIIRWPESACKDAPLCYSISGKKQSVSDNEIGIFASTVATEIRSCIRATILYILIRTPGPQQ